MSVRRRASGRAHYNYFRDFDPAVGGYVESDPLGVNGGTWSTYSYAARNPISLIDPFGLKVEVRCRQVGNLHRPTIEGGMAAAAGGEHCFIVVSCNSPKKIPETTISYPQSAGRNDAVYSEMKLYRSLPVIPPASEWNECPTCEFEQCLIDSSANLFGSNYRMQPYSFLGPNSNSFTRRLIEKCGGHILGRGPPTGWNDAGRVGF